MEKPKAKLLPRSEKCLKSSSSVREGVNLNYGLVSRSSTDDDERKTSCSGETRLRLTNQAEAGEEVSEEEAGGEFKVGQDWRGGRLLSDRLSNSKIVMIVIVMIMIAMIAMIVRIIMIMTWLKINHLPHCDKLHP